MNTSMRLTLLAGLLVTTALLSGCGNAQSRKAGYVRHGQQYYAAGDYVKARVEFSNAAQIDPKDAEVRYLLGQVAEKTGDFRDAVGQYRAAVSGNPGLAPARAALGRLYLYGGLPDQAMELVEPGLTTDPKNASLLAVRGAARQRLGDAAGAMNDAQAAVQLAPDDEDAIALLAALYRQHSQLDQAIGVVQAGLQHLPNNVNLRVVLADLDVLKQRPEDAETMLRQAVSLEPKVLVHRYQLAKFYLLQKNFDAAERTFRDVVALAPDNTEAKLQLIEFLSAERGRERATAEIDQFVAREPKNNALRLALGQYLAQTGGTDRAESIFRSVIADAGTKPDGLSARNRLAALLLTRNDISGASALIDQVLKENVHDNDALILRGNISLADGHAAAAINDLRSVLRDQPNSVALMRELARAYTQNGEPDLAEQTLRSAVQIAPMDPDTRLQLAQTLSNANKPDQALPLLEQLAKEAPTNIAVQEALFRLQAGQKHNAEARTIALDIQKARPDLGLGYFLTGLVDEADKKADDAEHDYDQALKAQPNAAEPLTALIRLEVQEKQAPKALQRLDAVIASAPNNGLAHNLKAELLASQGQTDAAIAAYQQALQAAPAWAPAYHGLAIAQLALKHNDDAVHTLQQGIDKTQGNVSLISDLATLYERLSRPDDAIALYDGLLAKNPKALYAANNLAMLLVTYKSDPADLARAQRLADQLASLSVVDVIDTRGWVKFKTGDYRGAESLLQQAVDKAPDSPEMHYHLGMAQLRSGEQQAAEQNLEAATRSQRAFAGMEDARAALAQLKKAG
jgi:tetratricopeptide (TPR) repeat protein